VVLINNISYLNVRLASRLLKVHEESLRRIIRIGTLPAVKLGGQWFIDEQHLNMFAATYNPKTGKIRRII
jgi:excisionase family DNA binding protein